MVACPVIPISRCAERKRKKKSTRRRKDARAGAFSSSSVRRKMSMKDTHFFFKEKEIRETGEERRDKPQTRDLLRLHVSGGGRKKKVEAVARGPILASLVL